MIFETSVKGFSPSSPLTIARLVLLLFIFLDSHSYAKSTTKIAFIGDQGDNNDTIEVLKLIKSEGSDFLLHQGDFDYNYRPDLWKKSLDEHLGPRFPIFAVMGNHDILRAREYQNIIASKLHEQPETRCEGNVGLLAACQYRDILMVQSSIGLPLTGYSKQQQLDFVEQQLSQSNAKWKICSWHLNQQKMQTGTKLDGTGWEIYELCRTHGAIIATAHEHSYSRTHTMNHFEFQSVENKSSFLEVSKGKTFAFVSGLGGHSIRPLSVGGPWWAAVYNADTPNAKPGSLFCEFSNLQAQCYFKTISHQIIDSFEIQSGL